MKQSLAVLFSVAVVAAVHGEDVHYLSATDARGVRHVISSSDPAPAAWKADMVFSGKPDYPYGERSLRHEGVVVIRLDIDTKTGTTAYVTKLESSGFPKLDEAAVKSVARWRWRPGTWKQVEFPVIFTISGRRINGW